MPTLRSLSPVAALGACLLTAGCSIPSARALDPKRSHVYIQYWPPAQEGRLRLAVKDLIDMKGVVTTAGSEFLQKTSPPAKRDAACLGIARERQVQIVGKTNTTELAVGVSGINEYFGTPKSPITPHRDRVPGGSSCGSAVAVADGTADVAFGTDTAGSIRVPAACCGVFGLKTSFGLVPIAGVYPISPTHLDTIGPLAKDIPRLVQGMDLLQRGFSAKYAAAVAAKPPAGRIRIGRLYVSGTDPKIDRAIDAALAARGFQVVKLDAALTNAWKQAEKDGRTVAASDAWIYDQQFRGQPQVRPRTKAVFLLGELQYKTTYRDALARLPAWQATLRRTFQQVDFIALPTLKTLPPKVPLLGGSPAFEALFLARQNTVAVNYAGNPALAVPIPVDDPKVSSTSLQLIGPPRSEAQLINAGRLVAGAQK